MKLRRWFRPQQPLFIVVVWGTLGLMVSAQDQLLMKDGRTTPARVLEVAGSNVRVQVKSGTMAIPLSTIERVEMEPPPNYAAAQKEMAAGDYAAALPQTKAIVEKYRGLPVDWARLATAMLGDIHVELGQFPEAEAAYEAYERAYAGEGSARSQVGRARIAVAEGKFDEAKNLLAPIAEKAMSLKYPGDGSQLASSQAFYLLGRIDEAAGRYSEALENYLRTVTFFYQDPAAVESAQARADFLRKTHRNLAVP